MCSIGSSVTVLGHRGTEIECALVVFDTDGTIILLVRWLVIYLYSFTLIFVILKRCICSVDYSCIPRIRRTVNTEVRDYESIVY